MAIRSSVPSIPPGALDFASSSSSQLVIPGRSSPGRIRSRRESEEVRDLVISCSLTDETLSKACDLIRQWITESPAGTKQNRRAGPGRRRRSRARQQDRQEQNQAHQSDDCRPAPRLPRRQDRRRRVYFVSFRMSGGCANQGSGQHAPKCGEQECPEAMGDLRTREAAGSGPEAGAAPTHSAHRAAEVTERGDWREFRVKHFEQGLCRQPGPRLRWPEREGHVAPAEQSEAEPPRPRSLPAKDNADDRKAEQPTV
jgi:hypothetical protein